MMSAVENGYRVVTDQVNPEGKAIRYEYTVRFDGKDYPVTGSRKFEAISVHKIDDRTFDWTMKKGGKVVSQGRAANDAPRERERVRPGGDCPRRG